VSLLFLRLGLWVITISIHTLLGLVIGIILVI
jgi:hypothetical protein